MQLRHPMNVLKVEPFAKVTNDLKIENTIPKDGSATKFNCIFEHSEEESEYFKIDEIIDMFEITVDNYKKVIPWINNWLACQAHGRNAYYNSNRISWGQEEISIPPSISALTRITGLCPWFLHSIRTNLTPPFWRLLKIGRAIINISRSQNQTGMSTRIRDADLLLDGVSSLFQNPAFQHAGNASNQLAAFETFCSARGFFPRWNMPKAMPPQLLGLKVTLEEINKINSNLFSTLQILACNGSIYSPFSLLEECVPGLRRHAEFGSEIPTGLALPAVRFIKLPLNSVNNLKMSGQLVGSTNHGFMPVTVSNNEAMRRRSSPKTPGGVMIEDQEVSVKLTDGVNISIHTKPNNGIYINTETLIESREKRTSAQANLEEKQARKVARSERVPRVQIGERTYRIPNLLRAIATSIYENSMEAMREEFSPYAMTINNLIRDNESYFDSTAQEVIDELDL